MATRDKTPNPKKNTTKKRRRVKKPETLSFCKLTLLRVRESPERESFTAEVPRYRRLVAIDPGSSHVGIAVFDLCEDPPLPRWKRWKLVKAFTLDQVKSAPDRDTSSLRSWSMAQKVRTSLVELIPTGLRNVHPWETAVVIENPKGAGVTAGAGTATVLGMVFGMIFALCSEKFTTFDVSVQAWCRMDGAKPLKKEIRAQRTAALLSLPLSMSPDALDAVGLGAFSCGLPGFVNRSLGAGTPTPASVLPD